MHIRFMTVALCLFAGSSIPSAAQSLPLPLPAPVNEWPCAQRRVPKLSSGAFWSGPEIAEGLVWRDDDRAAELIATLVSRRVSLEDAEKALDAFAKDNAADRQQKLILVFAGVFSEIDNLRSDIIRGIGRFAKNQQKKAAQLQQSRDGLEAALAKADKQDGDLTRIADLQTQVQWLQRIYDDRESTTRFICEAPTLLEQRLFALAKLIEDRLPH